MHVPGVNPKLTPAKAEDKSAQQSLQARGKKGIGRSGGKSGHNQSQERNNTPTQNRVILRHPELPKG
eukprot:3502593-Heterocapsa_arctica.AAC.1